MDDPLRRYHIRTGVRDALSRHGISLDSPLCAELEANATIAAGDPSRVIMKNGNSLDAEIENRRSSARMNQSLPSPSRIITKDDPDSLLKNFEDIASGKVRVTG